MLLKGFLQSLQLFVSLFTAVIAHAAVVADEKDDLLPDASTADERGDEYSQLILYAKHYWRDLLATLFCSPSDFGKTAASILTFSSLTIGCSKDTTVLLPQSDTE